MPPTLYHARLPCPLAATEIFRRLQVRTGCVWLDSSRANPAGDGRWSLIAAEPVRRLRLRADGMAEHIHYRYPVSSSLQENADSNAAVAACDAANADSAAVAPACATANTDSDTAATCEASPSAAATSSRYDTSPVATESVETLPDCDPLQMLADMLAQPKLCLDPDFSTGLAQALADTLRHKTTNSDAADATHAATKFVESGDSLPSAESEGSFLFADSTAPLPFTDSGDSVPFADTTASFPFADSGGAVGYFSYELGRQWEKHRPLPTPFSRLPLMDWAFYNKGVLIDHQSDTATVVAASPRSEACARQLADRFMRDLLDAPVPPPQLATNDKVPPPACEASANTTCQASVNTAGQAVVSTEDESCIDTEDEAGRRNAYICAVEKTRAYIASGDIYQVNIAQHFCAPLRETAASLYLRLRQLNPAPYAAYLDAGEHTILSSSPELFLQKRGQRVRTRPIKGTRPRGTTAEADATLRHELAASEKERAELLMIVDLERNDLGRVCETGSVRVDALYRIESYATVHHLVADVSGVLRRDVTLPQLLRATFPGGSITGAPKVRAMEIIDEIEERQRGIFCGAIGVLGFNGAADLNIAIRTLLCAPAQAQPDAEGNAQGGQAPCGKRNIHGSFGAGLVWDSSPQHEYEETLHKAEALLKAIAGQGTDNG